MSENERRKLIQMVDLLHKLGVFPSFSVFSNMLNAAEDLFNKYGHYENYN